FEGNRFTNYTSSRDRLASDIVFFIGRDSRSNLWFGTDGGVTRFDGRVWTSLDSRDGLIGNNISQVFEDRDGAYWICADSGLTHYRPRRAEAPPPLIQAILDEKRFEAGAEPSPIEQGRTVRFKLAVNDLRTRPESRHFRYQILSERR